MCPSLLRVSPELVWLSKLQPKRCIEVRHSRLAVEITLPTSQVNSHSCNFGHGILPFFFAEGFGCLIKCLVFKAVIVILPRKGKYVAFSTTRWTRTEARGLACLLFTEFDYRKSALSATSNPGNQSDLSLSGRPSYAKRMLMCSPGCGVVGFQSRRHATTLIVQTDYYSIPIPVVPRSATNDITSRNKLRSECHS